MIGAPFFEVSEIMFGSVMTLLGTIATGVSAVLVAVVSRQNGKIKKTSQVVEEVRDQVANDHGTNLRDDLDVMRDENRALVEDFKKFADHFKTQMDRVFSDIGGLRRDIGRADRRDIEDGVEIRELRTRVDGHLDKWSGWSHEIESRVGYIENTFPGRRVEDVAKPQNTFKPSQEAE